MNLPEPATEDRLREIADDMIYLMAQDMLDGELARLEAMSPLEVATYFYLSSDCDVFAEALVDVMGGEIVAIVSASQGPVHRLVKLEDGRMVDAAGFQTLSTLAERYRLSDLSVAARAFGSHSEEADIDTAITVMATLTSQPFAGLSRPNRMKP